MTLAPRTRLLLTRPVDEDDVRVEIDGRTVTGSERQEARAFLGDWRTQARAVPEAAFPIAITESAVLLEVPTSELDDGGRVEPLAIWLSTRGAASNLDAADSFATACGRSYDLGAAQQGLEVALRAQRSLLKVRRPNFLQRIVAALRNLFQRATKKQLEGGR